MNTLIIAQEVNIVYTVADAINVSYHIFACSSLWSNQQQNNRGLTLGRETTSLFEPLGRRLDPMERKHLSESRSVSLKKREPAGSLLDS